MRHFAVGAALFCVCTFAFAADNLLMDADFAQVDSWIISDGSGWAHEADAGPDGGAALVFAGGSGRAAQQTVQFVTPNATHEVRAMLYSDGKLRPIVRVVEVQTGTILAHMTYAPGGGWQELSAQFTPPSADLRVMIFPDPTAAEELPVPDGETRVAQVELVQTGPAPALEMPDLGENIALGRPYTMEPAPNYSYTTDPGDATQLTDGEVTEGYFWTQTSTVGWSGMGPKIITIDLGEDQPISAISFRTAAGAAQVTWPASILIYVSLDGQAWHEVGDLMKMHTDREALPEEGVYAVRRIWMDGLNTHGAYVKIAVEPGGSYVFCDEIEVFRGEEALLAEELPGEGTADITELMQRRRVLRLIREQFERDLDSVLASIRGVPQGQRPPFEARAQVLARSIRDMDPIPMEGFVAILPMTDLERDIFRLQADVWRAQGKDEVRLWDMHRWDPLAPSQEPHGSSTDARVEIVMMQNEYRADVFNVTNAGERDLRLRLTVDGLPGAPNPEWLTLHEVQHVGTRWFTSVAAALPEADKAGDTWLIDVPPGMTRQVWVAANRPQMDAGTYQGAIEVRSVGGFAADVPVRLRIAPLRFPEEVTLNTGGWAYTDAESQYGVTPQNKAALIEHLKERYVNAPWATGASIRGGTFDDEGNIITPPDTTRFDDWVAMWPGAKIYLTYPSVGTSFDGVQMGTEVFNNKVGGWAKFWSDHMEGLGLRPDQLGVLLVDEPQSQEQYETITAWANAIKTAAPGIVIWEDPQPQNPDPWVQEMFEVADVLCPLRAQYISRPDWYREMLAERQAEGAELWFYSANGPARTFDPYAYYLMQAWHAFEIGAQGSNFWAFGDAGGVSCWNEYPATGNGPYCPSYIDDTSVTTAKYMEAIREGIEDFEYMTMLRARVEELEAEDVPAARLAAAKELLANAPSRVATVDAYKEFRWDVEKDRTVQDTVRVEVLDVLIDLK